MNKKLAFLAILFSGIAEFLDGGIKPVVMYISNIALIYLSYVYTISRKKNNAVPY